MQLQLHLNKVCAAVKHLSSAFLVKSVNKIYSWGNRQVQVKAGTNFLLVLCKSK